MGIDYVSWCLGKAQYSNFMYPNCITTKRQ